MARIARSGWENDIDAAAHAGVDAALAFKKQKGKPRAKKPAAKKAHPKKAAPTKKSADSSADKK